MNWIARLTREKAAKGVYWNKRCAGHKISMAAAGQKKVSSPLDVNNSTAAVTTAVRTDTRRARSEEKMSFHERTTKNAHTRELQTWRACLPTIFSVFSYLISPVSFPNQRGGRTPWPPGEDAGKGEVPVPEPAPADAYCQHEHKVGGAQALVQFSRTSFR